MNEPPMGLIGRTVRYEDTEHDDGRWFSVLVYRETDSGIVGEVRDPGTFLDERGFPLKPGDLVRSLRREYVTVIDSELTHLNHSPDL